ncbi:MAG: TonB-dependent receptor [Nitrospirae bacterium]|nr:MAG: TonB-dependent receptor [Nitrospirota bacterium]
MGLSGVLTFTVGYGLSRGEEPPAVKTEDVVISATKTPLPVSQVTSAVEVIKGEDLERKKIKSVIDALRLAQGVAAFSSGGPGTTATVRLRGAQSNHTLVILDGTIMNSPGTGEFDFANLTADNIERIEILRGAQSMLWGADAIGGVINIITKKGEGKPTASAFAEYGSFATLREGFQASGAKGPFDFSGSLNRWDTSSFSAVDYRRGASERDGFHNWQASGKFGIALPKDGRFEFSLRWWNSFVNLDNAFGQTAFDVFGSHQRTQNLTLSGMYDQPITSWWSQKLTLAQTNEHTVFDSGTFQKDLNTGIVSPVFPFPGDIEITNQRLEWQHNFQIGNPLLLTAGYQFRQEQGDNPNVAPEAKIISSNAGFAQAQVNYQERLLLTAGIRQDSYNVFGDATTYRVTGGYLLKEMGSKVRFSYATGFRAPTINQLFFPGFGNPNLKPEKSKSMDVGIDQHLFKDRLTVSAGYFWNRFQDLILGVASLTACSPPFFFCAQNIGQAKSQGWEAGFTVAILKTLDVKGQYTYTLTRDLSTAARLPRWPVHQASVGVSYQPIDPVRLNLDYRYVGTRFNDAANTQKQGSFGVVNLSGTYDVVKRVQVFGRVENLFNQQYEEVLFFGTPIRSVYGGVKLTY